VWDMQASVKLRVLSFSPFNNVLFVTTFHHRCSWIILPTIIYSSWKKLMLS
jgi:hypothetical protein